MKIQMVDLAGQYRLLKDEIDEAVSGVLEGASFINGKEVREFSDDLSSYMGGCSVVPCANGTDAIQIALMALGLRPGDEVIVPAFTYAATAEAAALLGLVPVFADVDPDTFNLDPDSAASCLSARTKAVVPVHLYGQSADMERIVEWAHSNGLYVVEDNAQAMGCRYSFRDGSSAMTGTIGDVGCTSFFPSKNLGCYGDGGALTTMSHELAERIRMMANHGQKEKYVHSVIGCNSRLDTVQAAVLKVKLSHLDSFIAGRRAAAERYRSLLSGTAGLVCPHEDGKSMHSYHQFTVKVEHRDELKSFLASEGIPSMVYYPVPLHRQKAYEGICRTAPSLDVSEAICRQVLSLPVYPEISPDVQETVSSAVRRFFSL